MNKITTIVSFALFFLGYTSNSDAQCNNTVSFLIEDEIEMPFGSVVVKISDDTNTHSFTSDLNGLVELDLSLFNVSVDKLDIEVVSPYENSLSGVSTLDLVLIVQQILDISPLSSIKILSSDLNGDQKVSSSDIVILRMLILGIIDELPISPIVVVKKPNGSEGFVAIDSISIENCEISNDGAPLTIVVAKRGDVNGNAR